MRQNYAAKWSNNLPYGLNEVQAGRTFLGQRDFQNLASLFFHGPAVSRCADPKPLLRGVFQSANRYTCHIFNLTLISMIALRQDLQPAVVQRPDAIVKHFRPQPIGDLAANC